MLYGHLYLAAKASASLASAMSPNKSASKTGRMLSRYPSRAPGGAPCKQKGTLMLHSQPLSFGYQAAKLKATKTIAHVIMIQSKVHTTTGLAVNW